MTGGYRKIKLFSLMVALVALGLAVVGGTWASTVQYEGAQATPKPTDRGNYAVDLQYYHNDQYVSAMNADVFDGSLWCPGRTEVIYLKLVNNEPYPVGITLNMDVTQNTFNGEMSYALVSGTKYKGENAESLPGSWTDFKAVANKQGDIASGGTYQLAYRVQLAPSTEVKGTPEISGDMVVVNNNEYYLALAIHMGEDTTNQDGTLNMHFNLQIDADATPAATPVPTPTATPQ